MTLAERFHLAVTQAFREQTSAPELFPVVLARAAARAVPVNGTGISMTGELRIPLGASDHLVARAERLQTTLGEGPCLTAAATKKPLVAGLASIAAGWPMFHRELTIQTPYQSVASIPLQLDDGRACGALDLYSVDPEALDPWTVEEVAADLGDSIAAMIFDRSPVSEPGSDFHPLRWLESDAVASRMNVWVGVGMLVESGGLNYADSLALLRTYAFERQASLDEVAFELSSRTLRPEVLLA